MNKHLSQIRHISEAPEISGYYLVISRYNGSSIYYYDKDVNKWSEKDGQYDLDDDDLKKFVDYEDINNLMYLNSAIDYEDFKEKLKLDYMLSL